MHDLLLRFVIAMAGCVSSGVKVPINNNQFSALVSWVYNLGVRQPSRSSRGVALRCAALRCVARLDCLCVRVRVRCSVV